MKTPLDHVAWWKHDSLSRRHCSSGCGADCLPYQPSSYAKLRKHNMLPRFHHAYPGIQVHLWPCIPVDGSAFGG